MRPGAADDGRRTRRERLTAEPPAGDAGHADTGHGAESRPGIHASLELALDLSVVIPSFNDRGHLADVLRALADQSPAVREVIVSHSGDGDALRHVPRTGVPMRVLHSDGRLFAGAARNAGVAVTTGRWLAFVDDDVIPAADWTARLAEVLADASTDACHVGSVAVDGRGRDYWGTCLWFIEFGSVHPYLPARDIEGGASANMLVSRSLFDRAGGFPDDINRAEDVQFMARCRAAGGRTLFVPALNVAHRNVAGFSHCTQHLRRLGAGSAYVRRLTRMRGGAFASHPLTLPLVVPARFLLIAYRVLRWGRGSRSTFLWHAPGILAGLVAWALGFAGFAPLEKHTPDPAPDRV